VPSDKNGFIYESTILGFSFASWLMRQRPQINGKEHLKNLPYPVIFTVTHDSYFEVPSLSKVYRAIKPRPSMTIMAKKDFLDGSYLSTNFFQEMPIVRTACRILDKTGIPKALFEYLNLISIPRPFVEAVQKMGDEVKKEISGQFDEFRKKIYAGFSTLIFPEGTTWGYGGLKKIRSAVHQLVSNTLEQYEKRVYILPINVKVDRLVQGWKDVFINVGMPQFVIKPKEDFNQYLYKTLQKLHTITFSQIGAYYLMKISTLGKKAHVEVELTKENLAAHFENIVGKIHSEVEDRILPAIDERLIEKKYLTKKVAKFVSYCIKKGYLLKKCQTGTKKTYILNQKRVLAQYPVKLFRKQNPVGFHANELVSLGEKDIEPLFSVSI
jgi:1-acyl-sn-glycerol-3-phosphate acyltransferase